MHNPAKEKNRSKQLGYRLQKVRCPPVHRGITLKKGERTTKYTVTRSSTSRSIALSIVRGWMADVNTGGDTLESIVVSLIVAIIESIASFIIIIVMIITIIIVVIICVKFIISCIMAIMAVAIIIIVVFAIAVFHIANDFENIWGSLNAKLGPGPGAVKDG